MNFYKHHIGDYDQATRHLSFVEDAAYSRLIRKYYAEERALPADLKKTQRLIGARTKEEKEAVEAVLEEFFELHEDGWHQSRCDEELEAAQNKALKNREIGKLGGRPKKTETQTEPTDNPNGLNPITQTVSENNPIQTPVTSNQTPEETSLSLASTVGSENDDEAERPIPGRHVQIAILLRAAGIKPFTSMHPLASVWAGNPKITDDLLKGAVDMARQAKGEGVDISPNYLRPIVEQLLTAPPELKPQAQKDDWFRSKAGIERKGRELGMYARGTESHDDFKDRIFAKLREGKAA